MVRPVLISSIVAALIATACSTADPAKPASPNAASVAANAKATPSVTTAPTFATDVEAIVQEKCQNCHHAGGIAPFSLITYEDVKGWANDSKLKVQAHEMPPWGAYDQDDCKMAHTLKDDLRMTDAQVDTFSRWVDAGMPLGDATKRPPLRTEFPVQGLADKTDTLGLAAPRNVEPGGDDIRCFPIDPNFTTDTYVTGTNVLPGDPRVVHHVIVYLDPKKQGQGKADAATAADPTNAGSYPCFGGPEVDNTTLLLAWAPGVPPSDLGFDAGIKVPANTRFVMQVHYHPSNVPVVDNTAFEIKRLPAGTKPTRVAQVILAGNANDAAGSNNGGRVLLLPGPDDPVGGPQFLIPSNVNGHTETMEVPIPEMIQVTKDLSVPIPEVKIATAGSHMHWAGVNMKVEIDRKTPTATQPANECLVSTPKYDFNWQRGYSYDEPYEKLPAMNGGDKLRITCTYNNTTSNKNVAKAIWTGTDKTAIPGDLHLGETTKDEMCLAAVIVVRPLIPGYD